MNSIHTDTKYRTESEHHSDNESPRTAVCYVRVGATEPTEASTARNSQLTRLHKYAATQSNPRLVDVIDMHRSANSTTRSGLYYLMALARAERIDNCYVTSLEILAQRPSFLRQLTTELEQHGVALHVVTDAENPILEAP
ncbi:recombinase family protein [Gordonia sp. ABSL11-1]|uniref:recombinase family protein n=1 Tax=Gordonia sp. ABSL11-1 TaxID=3053924 RepID=UPI0025745EF1|nr:recombinase family protein [Gordonia sp. ABSL11-1]MDL9944538.1 recombinase family protein [Gordonia sp. ABSL11-1]